MWKTCRCRRARTLGTGNKLNNDITGNNLNDTLSGGLGNDTLGGGAGVDLAIGGLGNDVYDVDDEFDLTDEKSKEGVDTVRSFVANYALGAEVENLVLMSRSSPAARAMASRTSSRAMQATTYSKAWAAQIR